MTSTPPPQNFNGQSVAFAVNEQKHGEVVTLPPPEPLPPNDTISTEPDSKESKDSQEPKKKKKKTKKHKKSKGGSKDSKEMKRWSMHKHQEKKKKGAIDDPNIPPI